MSLYTPSTFNKASQCRHCDKSLELGAKPIFQLHQQAKLLIIGQAPGIEAHQSGIAFNDASGIRLR